MKYLITCSTHIIIFYFNKWIDDFRVNIPLVLIGLEINWLLAISYVRILNDVIHQRVCYWPKSFLLLSLPGVDLLRLFAHTFRNL